MYFLFDAAHCIIQSFHSITEHSKTEGALLTSMLVFPCWFFGDAYFYALQHHEVFLSSNADGKGSCDSQFLLDAAALRFGCHMQIIHLAFALNSYLKM